MSVETLSVFGSPHIGVYIFANNKFSLIPSDVPPKIEEKIEETLGVETYRVSLARSRLIGVFLAGNDYGLVAPKIAQEDEIVQLRKIAGDLNILVVENIRETALGNLILVNNKGCLASIILPNSTVDKISDVLGVECIKGMIGGFPLVGSVSVVTNRGLLLPPLVSEEEIINLREIFRVEADIATVNRGRMFLRSGMVANDKGALVGEDTTGHELMRIQQILFSR